MAAKKRQHLSPLHFLHGEHKNTANQYRESQSGKAAGASVSARPARARLNLSTAARNQQWQAALCSDNRLHSQEPFIARGARWQMDIISVSLPLNLFPPFSSRSDIFWGSKVSRVNSHPPALLFVTFRAPVMIRGLQRCSGQSNKRWKTKLWWITPTSRWSNLARGHLLQNYIRSHFGPRKSCLSL